MILLGLTKKSFSSLSDVRQGISGLAVLIPNSKLCRVHLCVYRWFIYSLASLPGRMTSDHHCWHLCSENAAWRAGPRDSVTYIFRIRQMALVGGHMK